MSKWIPDSYLSLILDKIKESDGQSVCSAQPTTYFEAIKGDTWIQSTAFSIGDVVRSPTSSNFVYECTVAGTSGTIEPGWGTEQDYDFVDGDITWTTHNNYSLAYSEIESTLVVEDDDDSGKKLTIPEIMGVVTHMSGTVNHSALVNSLTKELTLVTSAITTIDGNNDVVSGRTTIFYEFDINVRDPE